MGRPIIASVTYSVLKHLRNISHGCSLHFFVPNPDFVNDWFKQQNLILLHSCGRLADSVCRRKVKYLPLDSIDLFVPASSYRVGF
jgi:hypothetical protein